MYTYVGRPAHIIICTLLYCMHEYRPSRTSSRRVESAWTLQLGWRDAWISGDHDELLSRPAQDSTFRSHVHDSYYAIGSGVGGGDDPARPGVPRQVAVHDQHDVAFFQRGALAVRLPPVLEVRQVLSEPAAPEDVSEALGRAPVGATDQIAVVERTGCWHAGGTAE